MELRHLRYFVAVAEELHFRRAAERLHISQPPLSHQIQDLERELGVELFHRSRRSVALTEVGRLFLEEARHVLGDAEHAVEIAQKAGRGEIGRLCVGFGPLSEGSFMRTVLARFLARFPEVQLDLRQLYTEEQLEALARREIQVAFPLLPVPHRGLVVERIGVHPLVAAVPAGSRLAAQSCVRLSDLRKEPLMLVSRERSTAFYDLIVDACEEAGFTPNVAHEPGQVMTALGFVAAGLGVCLLPAGVIDDRRDDVVFRPLAPPVPTVELGMVYRREGTSRALSAFCEVVREVTRRPRLRTVQAVAGA